MLPVADVISFVRRRLHEVDADDSTFSDVPSNDGRPDILGFINDARIPICTAADFSRAATSFIGTGDVNYPLPEDLLEIEKLTTLGIDVEWLSIRDSVPFSPLEPIQANQFSGGYGALVKGDQIYFLPALSSGEQRVLHYTRLIPEVEDVDANLDAPRSYLNCFAYWVLGECFMVKGNERASVKYESKYEVEMRRTANREKRRQFPGRRQMKVPRV